MVRNSDLFISVPTLFRCPISLDVMKSPVSLCTGVTYDRSSIQRWLDNGNNTCPATMQILHSKDFVPNHTLHRLIQIWSDSIRASSSASTTPTTISSDQVRVLVAKVVNMNVNGGEVVDLDLLKKIVAFGEVSEENRRFLGKIDGFARALLGLICNVDLDLVLVEVGVRVLDLILLNKNKDWSDGERELVRRREFLDSIVLVLEKGGLSSRISSVRVLEIVSAVDSEVKITVAENESVLYELIRLTSETVHSAKLSGLSGLIAVSSVHRRIKSRIVQAGAIQTLSKIISESSTTTNTNTNTTTSSSSSSSSTSMIIESALRLLEMLSACKEGRAAICENEICVGAIVQKMMKVSKVATEHATVILWSVCYLFRDQRAQEVVSKSNGLTKLLLLMQSDCSPSVRQMCIDLIKIFRVNSKSCLSSYDTKTTHIMPF